MSTLPALGRLHVVTDERLQDRHTHVELAGMAARGGADVVQYREKRPLGIGERIRVARDMLERVRTTGARLVVNDHVEVALACDAAGVHLGAQDMEPALARRRLGRGVRIGGTANGEQQAIRVSGQPVDYLGVGPVFGTESKEDPAPALGLAALERIVNRVSKPVIAIGGITADRVAGVLATGVFGIAVLSAVVCRPDPEREVARLRAAIDAARSAMPTHRAAGNR